jgi:hypothetical protein
MCLITFTKSQERKKFEMFLNLGHYRQRPEVEIRQLRGGVKHDRRYFIGIRYSKESDLLAKVLFPKLRNQMGSQKTQKYPRGYEPFITTYGERDFCLQNFTFPVPVLFFPSGATQSRVKFERRPAVLLDRPRAGGIEYEQLKHEAKRFDWGVQSTAKARRALVRSIRRPG